MKWKMIIIIVLLVCLGAMVFNYFSNRDTLGDYEFYNEDESLSLEDKGITSGSTWKKEKCYSIWGVKLCGSFYASIKSLKICGRVGSLRSCKQIYKASCLKFNPTDFLVNLKVCAEDVKITSSYMSWKMKAKACFSYFFGEKCKTFWSQRFRLNY